MRYQLENSDIVIEVSEVGATLTRFIDKKTNTDLVCGFDSDEEYAKNCGCNIGATIGRNCNRIGGASFVLNGKTYNLRKNDGNNNLHGGGREGFAFKYFSLVDKKDDELVFEYLSRDLEEGFPGNLTIRVSYKLENNNLIISFTGSSDADTVFNVTNHSYFNMGDLNVLDQQLHITSNKYAPTDETGLTLSTVKNVEGTPFDFTSFRRIGDALAKLENGIDNNYVWENMDDKLLCQVKNDKLQMNVYSNLPDMHVYTANYLETEEGKYGRQYHKYGAICFEAQFYPNAINYDEYIKPILKANETKTYYIKYEIK